MSRRVPFALLVLATLLVLPATVAAAGPELQATVVPGREIDVAGSGFPASSDVTLVIQRSSHPDETRALTADAAGSFTTTIDAGPGRGGAYTLVATSGQLTATTQVVAVETAGGAGSGIQGPPPTDAAPQRDPVRNPAGAPFPVILVIVLAGALGAGLSMRRERQTPR
ncbi:MAG TPA: hypothetical protein VF302_08715 [Candidatus Limnocylindrales bacterium]